ncbi:alcohol dehydrogenase [Pseudocercospora fuligena]|uniref:Alcohol dehydrogenase n=1 Tax=Pseudocercospora fuligena TaxID=685502 RepID=A0A8H6VDI5_9PEZI|nr:alcohol dehydrogenase [Pseudocercospora fuligena]
MALSQHKLTTFYFDTSSKTFTEKSTTKELGYNDVLIKTTHSGICFTDVHAKEKECGLGHEGVGHIVEVGPAVKHLKAGDRVGWGWLHTSCGHCSTCVTGYRQYCSEARGFAFSDLDQGAFSDYRIINSHFAYVIPEGVSSVNAAPLMCAGASVFEALDAAGTRSNDRVGVVGIGGLGHMAVKFARAMGCAVTAMSSDGKKMSDAFALGADEYRDMRHISTAHHRAHAAEDPEPMNINVMLITSNAVPNLEVVMPLLARRATIVLMTIQMEPLQVPYMQFVLPGHRMIASTEASRENHIKMLEFADRQKIEPWVEVFDMTSKGLQEAFTKLEKGAMRYRGVVARHQA